MVGKWEEHEQQSKLTNFSLVVDKPFKNNPKKQLQVSQDRTLQNWKEEK